MDAMDGEPGVRSARYLSPTATYPERFAAILRRLAGVPAAAAHRPLRLRRRRRRRPAGAVRDPRHGRGPHQRRPGGHGGFGYDPIFFSPELGCTLAEAGDAKAAVSHRGRAFTALARWLDDLE